MVLEERQSLLNNHPCKVILGLRIQEQRGQHIVVENGRPLLSCHRTNIYYFL